MRASLLSFLSRVIIRNESVEIAIRSRRLAAWIGGELPKDEDVDDAIVNLSAPVRLQQRGQELRLVFPGESETPPGQLALIRLLARAHRIRHRLFDDRSTIEEAAALESVTASYVTRVVRLAFLAPDLTARILAGRNEPHITATKLLADSRLSLDWKLQRWAEHGLKPHLVRSFKISNDPDFTAKVEDIVGLYLDPPEKALVLSVDEKSQIQALDRTQPGLPLKKGRAGTMTHDYKRNGTTTLFAALDIASGTVIGECLARHRATEFLSFLRTIDRQTPAFASRQIDRGRPAYGRFREDRPRQCIFIGTTNDDKYLRDLTGNRRWWPVKTDTVDLDALRADRDQLWAEAAYCEARGESIVLAEYLWPDAAREQEARLEDDPWKETLATIEGSHFVVAVDGYQRVKTKDIFDTVLSIPKDRQEQHHTKRLAGVMRKAGWEGPIPLRFSSDDVARGYQRRIKRTDNEEADEMDRLINQLFPQPLGGKSQPS